MVDSPVVPQNGDGQPTPEELAAAARDFEARMNAVDWNKVMANTKTTKFSVRFILMDGRTRAMEIQAESLVGLAMNLREVSTATGWFVGFMILSQDLSEIICQYLPSMYFQGLAPTFSDLPSRIPTPGGQPQAPPSPSGPGIITKQGPGASDQMFKRGRRLPDKFFGGKG